MLDKTCARALLAELSIEYRNGQMGFLAGITMELLLARSAHHISRITFTFRNRSASRYLQIADGESRYCYE